MSIEPIIVKITDFRYLPDPDMFEWTYLVEGLAPSKLQMSSELVRKDFVRAVSEAIHTMEKSVEKAFPDRVAEIETEARV